MGNTRAFSPDRAGYSGDARKKVSATQGPTDLKPNGAECKISTPPRFCLSSELTARQREVLNLAAQGLSNREIGTDLELSPQTVRRHLQAIRVKLSARNTAHAVAIALTKKFISLEDHHEHQAVTDDRSRDLADDAAG
jgi:DNA-binding NarL/FixJ family response regulator